ncbi:MAG: dephospho-CoA kinase [Solirubrobacterales bacterium]
MTGGIAAGKSTVLGLLEKAGVPTLSADRAVHEVYEDPEVIALVADRLGADVIKDGAVDRDAVAEAIFVDPPARSWLEQLTWPRVGQKIIDFRKRWEAAADPPRAVVVEVPLLFEAGMDQAFDTTVSVVAGKDTRIERAEARGDVEVAAREERQMPQEEKAERADHVIVNDGTLEELAVKVDRLLAGL